MPRQRILIADDDPFVRDLVRHKLGVLGFDVSLARDGTEAIERAYSDEPDLIVLDVLMPELNGLETLCQLKADPALAAIPVLMLTALRGESDVRGALRFGAVGYIVKPFQLEPFAARVKAVLQRKPRAVQACPPAPMARYLD